jgi:hypothetical protein
VEVAAADTTDGPRVRASLRRAVRAQEDFWHAAFVLTVVGIRGAFAFGFPEVVLGAGTDGSRLRAP